MLILLVHTGSEITGSGSEARDSEGQVLALPQVLLSGARNLAMLRLCLSSDGTEQRPMWAQRWPRLCQRQTARRQENGPFLFPLLGCHMVRAAFLDLLLLRAQGLFR